MKTLNSQLSTLICLIFLATGCETWNGLSPSTQAVLKAGAKLALSYGVAELGDRVKEVRPFQGQLKGLIETTFAKPLSAEETGKALKAGVVATVPPELREPVLAQFRESLAGGKTTAASPEPNRDFNRRVASNL